MQAGLHVTSSTSVQILLKPGTVKNTLQPFLVQAIINPKRGMEGPLQTPQPPRTCSSPGPSGKSCWSLDTRVAVLLVTLAGAVILLLLYKLLQLKHRLKLARARHALEYYSFCRTATYTLKHAASCQELQDKNGTVSEAAPPVQVVPPVTPTVVAPLPPPPVPSAPPLPLPPPPVLHTPPSVLAFPIPLPVFHTTPPSPHLSWGACSDADVYSRIGAFRPSRLSSLSNHSKVILFEHSSF